MRHPTRELNIDAAVRDRLHRRTFLGRSAMGITGLLAAADLLRSEQAVATAATAGTIQPTPRATRVICLFQNGGPSQMDLFDPKPELNRLHGQKYTGPSKVDAIMNRPGAILGSPFSFRRHGESGIELSECLPHTATIADEITLVRSMQADTPCHEAALRLWGGGSSIVLGRPTVGSWVEYGLGSLNDNLPAYVVLPDPDGPPVWGANNWTNGWLPARYQGTVFRAEGPAVLNLRTPADLPAAARENQLRHLSAFNRRHLERFPDNTDLAARIANFEMAARMQASAPEATDLGQETAATRARYGLDHPATASYGRRVLMARRLIERGVRYVSVYLAGQPWDTHSKNSAETKRVSGMVDQASAALVADLKERGLLDTTIVLWMGEFGRTFLSEGADGRDHSRWGFSIWMAGGGFKRGYVHGATDEFGNQAIDGIVRFHDLHATLLHLLGIDHTRLTVEHDGRLESLTDHEVTKARVVPELIA
jgi:hypothetical protein